MISLTLTTINPNISGLELVRIYAKEDVIIALWNIRYSVQSQGTTFTVKAKIDEAFDVCPITHAIAAESLEDCTFNHPVKKISQTEANDLHDNAIKINFEIISSLSNQVILTRYGIFIKSDRAIDMDAELEPNPRRYRINGGDTP